MFGDRNTSHYLVVGAEGGVFNRSLDFARLQFGDQHNGEGSIVEGSKSADLVNFPRQSFTVPDVALGLLWFSVFNETNNAYAGFSASHINGPNVSFGQDSLISIYTRYTAHAGGQLGLTKNLGIIPGVVVFSQGPSFLLNAGASIRFALNAGSFNNSNSFQVGAWVRMVNNYLRDAAGSESTSMGMESIILSTRFEYENFNIGFSYDMNVSDLKDATNGNGAYEFSLVYLICGSESRGVYCPTF